MMPTNVNLTRNEKLSDRRNKISRFKVTVNNFNFIFPTKRDKMEDVPQIVPN